MRNQRHRTLVGRDPLFEPTTHVNIEVVVGFIKQHHLGRLQQQFGQRHQATLATAQEIDRRVELFAREPESAQHRFASGGGLFGIDLFEPRQRFRIGIHHVGEFVVGEIFGHALFEVGKLRFERAGIAGRERDHGPSGCAGRKIGILLQVANPQSALPGDRSFIRLDQASGDLEQGALAGAVLADQRDPVARSNLEQEIFEELIAAVGMGDPRGLDQERHCQPFAAPHCAIWQRKYSTQDSTSPA